VDRVKPERNLGAAKPPVGERRDEHPARMGSCHGTAVYGPVRTVVWEGRSREASPYPDSFPFRESSIPLRGPDSSAVGLPSSDQAAAKKLAIRWLKNKSPETPSLPDM
jgi:hypothetical protein